MRRLERCNSENLWIGILNVAALNFGEVSCFIRCYSYSQTCFSTPTKEECHLVSLKENKLGEKVYKKSIKRKTLLVL